MANPHKGEVGFEAGGKSWTLHFGTNALCALEDTLDLSVNQIASKLSSKAGARMGLVRTVFHAGLTDLHEGVTAAEAGDIIDELGFGKAAGLIGEAFQRAFPDAAKQAEGEGAGKGPRKGGAAGTGRNS